VLRDSGFFKNSENLDRLFYFSSFRFFFKFLIRTDQFFVVSVFTLGKKNTLLHVLLCACTTFSGKEDLFSLPISSPSIGLSLSISSPYIQFRFHFLVSLRSISFSCVTDFDFDFNFIFFF